MKQKNTTHMLLALILLFGFLLSGCNNTDNTNNQNNFNNDNQNANNSLIQPDNIIFNATNCKAIAYDFGGGVESWSAALNCTYYTNINCYGLATRDLPYITVIIPNGKNYTLMSYCNSEGDVYQAQAQHLRISEEWTTPLPGTYKLLVTQFGKQIYEKNITFAGQKITLLPILSGAPTYDAISKKYYAYDSKNYEGIKLQLTNIGDLPAFTENIVGSVDGGKAGSIVPKFILLRVNRTATINFNWDGTITAEQHSLTIQTYGTLTESTTRSKLSEDKLNFDVPSLAVVK